MKKFIFLFVFAMSPEILLAEVGNKCVFVILGGSKISPDVLPPGYTDISDDVYKAVTKEAKKSGCQIISMANDEEEKFLNNLKQLSKFKSGTSFHIAFTDHGSHPKDNVNESMVVTGPGDHTTYKKLLDALEKNIPKGSHVSFQTNSCWPNVSEAIIANNLESRLDICGGSSTAAEQMSWNTHKIVIDASGNKIGPYGAIGLQFANEYKQKNGHYPSTFEFHYQAKKGDFSNMSRQPGLTTSLIYAKNQLIAKKIHSPLFGIDMNEVFSKIDWNKDTALDDFLNLKTISLNSEDEVAKATCKDNGKLPLGNLINAVKPLSNLNNLINSNFELLPSPYREQSWLAKNWLKKNQKKLIKILNANEVEKDAFLKKYKNFPKEKYVATEAEWNKLMARQSQILRLSLIHI